MNQPFGGPELRVDGVEDLWVVDASIMLTQKRGHLDAPAMMFGEKAVALIRSG